jgi:hypothetical protein
MTTANPVLPQATAGCWETFSQTASTTASWLGHQVSELGAGLKAGALKVADYVKIAAVKVADFAKSVFASVKDFVAPYYQIAKGAIVAHKKEIGIAAGLVTAGVAVTLLVQHLLKKEAAPAPALAPQI